MFLCRESVNPHPLFFNDGETIGKFKTKEEAVSFLTVYAKTISYKAFVRVVDTENLKEELFTWDKNGNLFQPYKRGN